MRKFEEFDFFLVQMVIVEIYRGRLLSSLNISSEGTEFEIFPEHVSYLYFVLLRRAWLFDKLLQVMLLLITGVIFIFVQLRQR